MKHFLLSLLFLLPLILLSQSYNRVVLDQANNTISHVVPTASDELILNYRTASNLFILNTLEKLDNSGQTSWKYYSSISYTSDFKLLNSDMYVAGTFYPNCDVADNRLGIEKVSNNGTFLDSITFRVKTLNHLDVKLGISPGGSIAFFTDSNTYILNQQLSLLDTISYAIAGGIKFSTDIGNNSVLLGTDNGALIFDFTNYTFNPIQLDSGAYVHMNDSVLLSYNTNTSKLYKYGLPALNALDSITVSLGFAPDQYHAQGNYIIFKDDTQYALLTEDFNLLTQGTFKYPNFCGSAKPAVVRISDSGQMSRVLGNCSRDLQLEVESHPYTTVPPNRFDRIDIENIKISGTDPDTVINTGNPSDPYEVWYNVFIQMTCRNNSITTLTAAELTYDNDFLGFCSSGDNRLSLSGLNVAPGDTFVVAFPNTVKNLVTVAQPRVFPFNISFCSANTNMIIDHLDTGMLVNLSWVGLEEELYSIESVFPNPFNNELNIDGDFEPGTVFSLMAQDGRVVFEQELNAKMEKMTIPGNDLPSGFYILSVKQKGIIIHKKLIRR